MKPRLPVCYLCGKEISSDLTREHVPPKQFFPSKFRKNLQLKTFPAHNKCNQAYKSDEDYFIVTLGSLAMDSGPAGKALWSDISKTLAKETFGSVFAQMVSNEFSDRTESGLILPDPIMLKNFDSQRVYRIVWKIIRGLFYKEYGIVLSERKAQRFGIIQPKFKSPNEIERMLFQSPSRGSYPDIFDYKYIFTDKFHYWGFLLWDEIIITTLFHLPDCSCQECLGDTTLDKPHM